MPVKITQTSVEEPAAEQLVDENEAERISLVDELYELTSWFEGSGAKEKIARMDQIKKALTADVNSRFADRRVARTLEGTVGRVEISAGSCKREVTDPIFVQKIVGDEAFYKGITVPLGFVDAHLTAEERLNCVSETPGAGARKVTVSAR